MEPTIAPDRHQDQRRAKKHPQCALCRAHVIDLVDGGDHPNSFHMRYRARLYDDVAACLTTLGQIIGERYQIAIPWLSMERRIERCTAPLDPDKRLSSTTKHDLDRRSQQRGRRPPHHLVARHLAR